MLAMKGLLSPFNASGPNLITNPSLTSNLTGWVGNLVSSFTRVDSTIDPGVPSDGLDSWCGKIVASGSTSRVTWMLTGLELGADYEFKVRCFAPSSNSLDNAAAISIATTSNYNGLSAAFGSVEDLWQTLTLRFISNFPTMYAVVLPRTFGAVPVAGDVVYFDSASLRKVPPLALGPELCLDPGFHDASKWLFTGVGAAGLSVGGGQLTVLETGSVKNCYMGNGSGGHLPVDVGAGYRIAITCPTWSAGSTWRHRVGLTLGPNITVLGTFVYDIIPTVDNSSGVCFTSNPGSGVFTALSLRKHL